jgi:phenylacetate-CoA ligase
MKDKIYRYSPYFIKVILLNIIALLNFKKRNTKGYLLFLNRYNNYWELDIKDLEKIQNDELKHLLKEVYFFSPFYQKIFKGNKIRIEEIDKDPRNVLNRLPLLSKADRRTFSKEILNNNPERKLVEIGYTSGTSGTPTENYLDQESIDRSFALWSRFHETIGIKKGMKSIRFSGRLIVNPEQKTVPFWVYNYFDKQLLMSTYHLTERNIVQYINKINKFSPQYLDGYPSAFYIIANFAINNGIKLKCQPIAITTTAETLYDYQRSIIQKFFQCKVYNQYASSEGSPFITECKSGSLHVNMDSGIFEFLNKNNEPAKPGEIARMVVTSFRNLKTPLIRYDILDTVILSEHMDCECGCKMPIIEKIIGREDDILWTEEKGYVGRMDTAYKGLEGILQSQIIQLTPSKFIIRNVIDKMFKKDIEYKFKKNLIDRLGSNIELNFEYVDSIPLGKNGKFEAVKRKFNIDDSNNN